MSEIATRQSLIDPLLQAKGWGVVADSQILREHKVTAGTIQARGERVSALRADYVLKYRGQKLAVIEAKSSEFSVGEAVAQAKNYAKKLQLDTAYACNGKKIYQICMKTGKEGLVAEFPTPDELWNKTFSTANEWRDKFNQVPLNVGGTKEPRYYQEIAVNNALNAIAEGKDRILLTLATGTGKTFIAFQIVWKLFQTRWTLNRNGLRKPRVLFLTDRNILADQAFHAFTAFPEDELVRIRPEEIRKKGTVPTSGSIFFTIFQTLMSDDGGKPYFNQYHRKYFDLIIIDECHRGGANDESNWHDILEYFSPVVQLGLTATPRLEYNNVNTYNYFGSPVYTYSLKEGISDGFLTPFKVKRIQTTIDEYVYTSDDHVIEGEVDIGRLYIEPDFNKIVEIKKREAIRVKILLNQINQSEKTIVFCANQDHAAAIRDLINQYKISNVPEYCVRVTANDGELGEQQLRSFQDNEKTIPTILTTSQKLATGVDARNIRNIVLLRPINSLIEFKQIIGRGTRLFDGKSYFTVYDFVGACENFHDSIWDGDPIEFVSVSETESTPLTMLKDCSQTESGKPELSAKEKKQKVVIELADGKERQIQYMISSSFWKDGRIVSAEEFFKSTFVELKPFFPSEKGLRATWSDPGTRAKLLKQLAAAGYGKEDLANLQDLVNANNSDLFDVLEYICFGIKPIPREVRVAVAQSKIFSQLNKTNDKDNQKKKFLEFVLSNYIQAGVEELAADKLTDLLRIKYRALKDAIAILGDEESIRKIFYWFQQYLYSPNIGGSYAT
jgi:type I restriction enzyme R subunit